LIAEGPGADYVPAGSRQYASKQPSGDARSLYDTLKARLFAARTDADLEREIEWAESEVRAVKKAKRPPVTDDEKRYWIEREPANRSDSDVAAAYDVTAYDVERIRRDRATERWIEKRNTERAMEGKRLAAEGLSTRKIASMLGVSHSTVRRDLAA
jgi:hypothetical protein